mmetsp:Transcript_12797/g.29814  ORF Transcript_12797/g.29814 Transcript_12797/m.29814 type:complete len:302 (+) Transcript_12797:569-1474(+)
MWSTNGTVVLLIAISPASSESVTESMFEVAPVEPEGATDLGTLDTLALTTALPEPRRPRRRRSDCRLFARAAAAAPAPPSCTEPSPAPTVASAAVFALRGVAHAETSPEVVVAAVHTELSPDFLPSREASRPASRTLRALAPRASEAARRAACVEGEFLVASNVLATMSAMAWSVAVVVPEPVDAASTIVLAVSSMMSMALVSSANKAREERRDAELPHMDTTEAAASRACAATWLLALVELAAPATRADMSAHENCDVDRVLPVVAAAAMQNTLALSPSALDLVRAVPRPDEDDDVTTKR